MLGPVSALSHLYRFRFFRLTYTQNATEYSKQCWKEWKVEVRYDWPAVVWGGQEVYDQASNIVFSNGGLDPWRVGGVLSSASESVRPLPPSPSPPPRDFFLTR